MKSILVNALIVSTLLSPLVASAQVFEPLFEEYRAKNRSLWNDQDSEIDRKVQALFEKYGKRPNIIYILADDIGWGELGSYGGGKVRGTPTPNLDTIANEGMKFLSFYSEPICTPSRVALMTGRLPIRTGLDVVLFPGQTQGLVAEEYTIAELLSDSGYYTAMFGKWHLGELSEHQPTKQGFDYAYYTLYNGGVWPWEENSRYYDPENVSIGEVPYILDMPKQYTEDFGIEIYGVLEATKGGKIREVAPLSLELYNQHDNDLTDRVLKYIESKADSSKPFFVYFASNANQVFGCPPTERTERYVDGVNCQAAQLAQHDKNVRQIVDKVSELDIAENTLIVWMSDNGPMYDYYPSAGYSWLRGEKGEVYEGGVRVPAIASWPGVIGEAEDPLDLVHITDWYVTAARVAGSMDKVPRDRVMDGLDQSSLLLLGEGHGRRNYIFHYERGSDPKERRKGMKLGALRYEDIKFHVTKGEIYNIVRDPGEKHLSPGAYLWAAVPFELMIRKHNALTEKYPNRTIQGSGEPARLDVVRYKDQDSR